MSRHATWLSTVFAGLVIVCAITSCGRDTEATEEAKVKLSFESCKAALVNNQTDQLVAFIPRNVDVYLNQLKANARTSSTSASAPMGDSPGVDLLLRTALVEKVPDDIRSGLTFNRLMQRIGEKRLLNLHNVEQIDIGRVSVNGDHASAELYYQGTLTALRLPFVLEDKNWKIDILAVLPYAEILMRLDRAVKGETEGQQVEFLVSKLPSL